MPKSRSLCSPFLKSCAKVYTCHYELHEPCSPKGRESVSSHGATRMGEHRPISYSLQHIKCTYQRRLQWLWPSCWVKQNLGVLLGSTEKEKKRTSGCIWRHCRWHWCGGGRGTVYSSLAFHSPHMVHPLITFFRTTDILRGGGVWAITFPWINFLLLSKICLLLQETKISFTYLFQKLVSGEDMMGMDLLWHSNVFTALLRNIHRIIFSAHQSTPGNLT